MILSFQRAEDYQPPTWPDADRGQQFHIDVTVDDLNQAEREVLALGATRTDTQPGAEVPIKHAPGPHNREAIR